MTEPLGIPVGTVGPQRARCLTRLRQAMIPAALAKAETDEPDPR